MNNFDTFLSDNRIYAPDEIPLILSKVRTNFRFSQINTKHKYFNVPAAFDIETSSFYDASGQKVGLMYVWMFGIYGCVVMGRTWEEFQRMISDLVAALDLCERKRLIVYVHNLQFDFQFFRSHFTFEKVFAIDVRQPLYALTDSGIEFRCSYLLSGYSLDTLGKNLVAYPIQKKTGDLDYNLVRHSGTPLTAKEVGYCVTDVKVVMSYIAEEIDRIGRGIAALPYTKTGYVREFSRNQCFYEEGKPHKNSKKRYLYMDLIYRLTLTVELNRLLKKAFAGGFVHANVLYYNLLVFVGSYDFTSSYPTVMIAEQYPMGTPEEIDCTQLDRKTFEKYLKCYCCLFTVHIYGLKEKPDVWENYISSSHCTKLEGAVINNGRVVSADYLVTTITEVDWQIINACYDMDGFRVANLHTWIKDYLPKDFVYAILMLYKSKTELKGVKGKEQEYQVSKGMLNSCYGMTVMSVLRDQYNYTDTWLEPEPPDEAIEIEKYNKKSSRFLYFPWGVWVTAYSRKNLFSGILSVGEDYVYSDTDSIKLRNPEKHKAYFESYNERIIKKLEKALDHHGFPHELIRPKTIEGVEKPLGVWDYEGSYKFKTLGAKRYMTEDAEGNLSLTVSGLNKELVVPHLQKRYKDHDTIFEFFREGLRIPPEFTGKKTHTYIDTERSGIVSDYLDNKAEYKELTSIHLEPAEYNLSISGEYNDFIQMIWKGMKKL